MGEGGWGGGGGSITPITYTLPSVVSTIPERDRELELEL